jgi:GAF domain-containing protein
LRTEQATLMPLASPESLGALALDAITLARLRRLPALSLMIVPLVGRNRRVGAITLVAAASRRTYGVPQLELAEDLASRVVLALENSQHYQATHAAERQLRRHAARLQALAEATRDFAAMALQWSELLETILRRIVGELADCCIIAQLAPDGSNLGPIALRHLDPTRELILLRWLADEPTALDEGLPAQVATTGRERLLSSRRDKTALAQLDPGLVEALALDEGSAILFLPLRHETTLGTVLIVRDGSWPEFTADDQLFLQEIIDRAALALENAELHRQLGEREQHLSDLVGRLITSQEEERRRVA